MEAGKDFEVLKTNLLEIFDKINIWITNVEELEDLQTLEKFRESKGSKALRRTEKASSKSEQGDRLGNQIEMLTFSI